MITNLLIFFVAMLAMSDVSRVKMEKLQEEFSGTTEAVSLRGIKDELSDLWLLRRL